MIMPAAVILLALSRGFGNNNRTITNWERIPQWEISNVMDYCINESNVTDAGFVMEDCFIQDLEETMTENITIWDLYYDTDFN